MNDSGGSSVHRVYFDFPADLTLAKVLTPNILPDYYARGIEPNEPSNKSISIAKPSNVTGDSGFGSKLLLLRELESLVEQITNPKTRPGTVAAGGGTNFSAPSFEEGNLTTVATTTLRHYGPGLGYGQHHADPYLLAKCIVIAFMTVLIVSLNTTFVWVLVKYRDSFNTDLYSCYNLSIAVADLLMGIFVTPLSIYPAYYGHWVYGNLTCKLTSYLQVVVWIVIWCHFMWIGADRYLALRKPYKYENGGSRRTRYKCWIAFSWLTAALITSPHLYGYSWSRYNANTYMCVMDWRLMTAYSMTVGALIMIPTTITLAFTYTRIFKQLFSNYVIHVKALNQQQMLHAKKSLTPTPRNLARGGGAFIFPPIVRKSQGRPSISYYRRMRKSIVGGLTTTTFTEVGKKASAHRKSIKHSIEHPDEIFVCDTSGTPLLSDNNINNRWQSIEMTSLKGGGGGADGGDILPTRVNPTAITTSLSSGRISFSSASAGAKTALLTKMGSSTDNKEYNGFTEGGAAPNLAVFDNSSYLISFLNVMLFVVSWFPWFTLTLHNVVTHYGGTHKSRSAMFGSSPAELAQQSYPRKYGNRYGTTSNTATTFHGKHPQISILTDPFHPDLEFVVSWIVISNSMWKPVLYWLLDRKFRVLVATLFAGKAATFTTTTTSPSSSKI